MHSLSNLVDLKRFDREVPLQSSGDNINGLRYLMAHTSESLFVLSWSVFSHLTMNKYGKYRYTKLRGGTLETVQVKSCCWLPSIEKLQEKACWTDSSAMSTAVSSVNDWEAPNAKNGYVSSANKLSSSSASLQVR